MFLHCIGADALKIYNTFNMPDDATLPQVLEKFQTHIIGECNVTYERYKFNQRQQKHGETFDQYITALKTLASSCDFCECINESLIRDKLITGILCAETRKKLLEQRNLNLQNALDICRSAEASTSQMKHIDAGDEVNKLSKSGRLQKIDKHDGSKKTCKFCGGQHIFLKSKCPAYGKTCTICKRENHFAKCCPSEKRKLSKHQRVRTVEDDTASDSDEKEWVNTVKSPRKLAKCKMLVNDTPVAFLLDTGSTVNILPESLATNLISSTDTCLKSYCNTRVKTIGSCQQTLINPKNNKSYIINFVAVEDKCQPVIGLRTAEKMNLLNLKHHNYEEANSLTNIESLSVFQDGLGSFPGVIQLKTNPNHKPTVMPDRRVPIALRESLKKELDRLTELNVIEPISEPTPWVNQTVVTRKKSGQLRICIDPKFLNDALLRERYTMPLLDDVLHELSQSTIFSKIDLRNGFWHVILDEESSKLTTFQTCFGRFRWLRLPFGLSVSSEIFERKVRELFGGLPGVVTIHDDIIVHGKDRPQHDERLNLFLAKCQEYNVKLNKEKLELAKTSINFMGHIISDKGINCDPEKTKAIRDFPTPSSIPELRRFLGIVQYVSRYIPNLTDIIHPLQNLLKKNVTYQWSTSQETAFQNVKKAISDSQHLAIYDQNKPLIVESDASEYGLGSVLIQEGRPLAFASRTLTDSERNYAQIEKELLAITFGLIKFHHYTYARPVTCITDHRPLVSITRKPLVKAPKRLQSLLLKIQGYNFEVVYKPGSQLIISDSLSRSPLSETETVDTISNLDMTPFTNQRLLELKNASKADPIMDDLKEAIMKGWYDSKEETPLSIRPFYNYRDELTVQDGIILRGMRIVIPQNMRHDLMNRVHAGHQGINSCLRRARELIFWPGMSSDIRNYIECCDTCATYSYRQPEQPLQTHDIPQRPWQKIATDLFTIKGRTYLVTVDYFSNFIELDFLAETTSSTVITKLKHHMARYGIPQTVISDNGPQYSSDEFRTFSKKYNFNHMKIAPGNSRANGLAESAVKTIKNMMIKCNNANEDQYLGLLNIRNTPMEGLTTSPVQRLMGRRTQTLTPATHSSLKPSLIPVTEHSKMHLKRLRSAQLLSSRRQLNPLKAGDTVRMEPIDGKKEWRKAYVTKEMPFNNYEVNDGKRSFIRARKFLRKKPSNSFDKPSSSIDVPFLPTAAPAQLSTPHPPSASKEPQNDYSGTHTPSSAISDGSATEKSPSPYKTRSGRIIKAPQKLIYNH